MGLLNPGDPIAQFKRNRRSISPVELILQSGVRSKADDVYGGRLPVQVWCLLDEFAHIGQRHNFGKLIATIWIREISTSIILQS